MNKDLTIGKPETVLWRFSIPMFISVIFQQMYSIADSVIAGKFAGENALAAVGASYPITMIFMAIAIGSNIGCSVIVSQLYGKGDYKRMKTAVSTTVIATFALSIFLSLLGFVISNPLLKMIQTPENIFTDSSLYLKIYIGGFLFLFLYNIATGIFTSLGDSKTPLYFLIGSSLGNIFLDTLFVVVFQMGVAGVAWATFIAQGIACILSGITMIYRLKSITTKTNRSITDKNDNLHNDKNTLFSFPMLAQISKVAIPSILQQSFVSVGNIFIQNLVNGYGSSVIAGFSAAIKLNTFTITSFATLANGLSSFTAQNIGAVRYDRVKKGFRASILLASVVAIPFIVIYFIFGRNVIQIFLNANSHEALNTGTTFLKIVSPFYIIIAIKLMADSVLRGAGSMRQFMAATLTDLILRVIISYILTRYFGVTGIWISWPIGWIVATILSVSFYKSGKWLTTNLLDDECS